MAVIAKDFTHCIISSHSQLFTQQKLLHTGYRMDLPPPKKPTSVTEDTEGDAVPVPGQPLSDVLHGLSSVSTPPPSLHQ